jgi:hypothetical protein
VCSEVKAAKNVSKRLRTAAGPRDGAASRHQKNGVLTRNSWLPSPRATLHWPYACHHVRLLYEGGERVVEVARFLQPKIVAVSQPSERLDSPEPGMGDAPAKPESELEPVPSNDDTGKPNPCLKTMRVF